MTDEQLEREQVSLLNELMDEFQEVWIGEPKQPKVDDEYLRYIERFIIENELYD